MKHEELKMEKPELDVIRFQTADVIATSNTTNYDNGHDNTAPGY